MGRGVRETEEVGAVLFPLEGSGIFEVEVLLINQFVLVLEDKKFKRLLFLNVLSNRISAIYIFVSIAVKDDFLSVRNGKPEILRILAIKLEEVFIILDTLAY
jgi:hypothetical protein